MKKIISMVLSFILILGCSTTAFAAETHNYDTENLPHDGADYFETEIKADEENEERISDFVTVYGYQYTNREYSQRIEKLKIQADEYRQAASQYESAEKTVAQLKAEMLRFKGKRKLTQEMVDLFVAQVRIYENKNLEIVLNYEDELKKFAELNMEREAG